MNILIVGANGLLGRYLVGLFSKEHKVHAVVRNKNKLNFELNENISIVEIDLTTIDLEAIPKDIEAIYYLAQSNKFRDFPDGSDDVLSVNITAPNILAKWAVNNGVKKFIYASSGGVYSGFSELAKEDSSINANEKLGFYPNSKLSAEMLLKNYEDLFNTFVLARPFFIYGVGQNNTMLIPRLISSIQNDKEVTLNGQVGIKINPIYVTDAAYAFKHMLDLEGNHIINIAGDEVVSLKELCLLIGKIISKEPYFKINKSLSNDLIADIMMMKEQLIKPRINLKKGIERMVI